MKFISSLLGVVCLCLTLPVWGGNVTSWVDPFIGTAKSGNTFPGAMVPWGMVSVSPNNDLHAPSGYIQGNPLLYGFGHVHLSGMGCADLGNVVLMPTVGDIQAQDPGYSYDSEEASPGYYKVHLKQGDIEAEMTATVHAGMSRYTFPACTGNANILVDAGFRLSDQASTVDSSFESHIKILSPTQVEGYSQSGNFCSPYAQNKQTVYFAMEFSKPAVAFGTWDEGGHLSDSKEQTGKNRGAFLRFSTAQGEPIVVKVGISYVSTSNAWLNLQTEIPGWDFDGIRQSAQEVWSVELSKITVEGGTSDQNKTFYTALYHCLMHPNVFSDVNGQYQTMAQQGVQTADGYTRYSVFALWDTCRSLHPLLSLVYPERELDMVKSLIEMTKESHELPRWELAGNETGVMVGIPAIPVIADTYIKGIQTFDTDTAYSLIQQALQESQSDDHLLGGFQDLCSLGFIPQDGHPNDWVWGSVSTTQEYALDLWALSQFAKVLGHDDDATRYLGFAGAYRHFYDPVSGFMRPRNHDNSWARPFDPQAVCCDKNWPGSGGPGFVEGNAWDYLFYAPQDLDGLIQLLGGPEVFGQKLQALFDGGHFDPSAKPSLVYPYLFDGVPGQAWRAQKEVRAIMAQYYKPTPDGLPGNDDGGALSAWYVFSALGFYPLCPGSDLYGLGSPLFSQVTLHLSQAFYPSPQVILKTIDNSDQHLYVTSILVNGIPSHEVLFKQQDLIYGGNLVFRMGVQPKP